MLILADILLPVMLVIALGFAMGKASFLSRDFFFGLNRLVYFFGLPAVIVHSLAGAVFDRSALALSAVFIGLAVAASLGAAVVARMMKLPPDQRGSFVQASFRSNLAYIALPVLSAMTAGSAERDRLLGLAMLALGPAMVAFNVIAAVVLTPPGTASLLRRAVDIARVTLRNPLVQASGIGMTLAVLKIKLPQPVDRTLQMIGDLSIPSALLCIGAVMAMARIGPSWKPAFASSIIKVFALPALAWPAGVLAGLDPMAFTVLMVFASCPTAVASYIMAVQMGSDERIASQSIIFSTLLCAIPLSVLILVFARG